MASVSEEIEAYMKAKLGADWQLNLEALIGKQLRRPHAEIRNAFVAELGKLQTSAAPADQIDFGTNGLVIDGITVAKAYVSAGDTNKTIWIEDWAIKDKESFLDLLPSSGNACQIQYTGAYGTGADAQIITWTAGTDPAWRATMIGSYYNATDLPNNAPDITVDEFELRSVGTTARGHLLREIYTSGGETWVDDYWVLRKTYNKPTATTPVTIVYISSTTNLKSRLAALKAEAVAAATNNDPALFIFMSSRLYQYS